MSLSIEQMEQQLDATSDSNEKVDILNELSEHYRHNDTPRSLELSDEASVLSEALDYKAGIAHATQNKVACYTIMSENERALKLGLESLKQFRELGDKKREAQALINLGNIFFYLGNDVTALDHYIQSLKIYEKEDSLMGTANSLLGIGNIYLNMGEFEKAKKHFFRSLELTRNNNDTVGQRKALNNVGHVFYYLGEYKKALDFFLQSLNILQEGDDLRGQIIAMANVGATYMLLDDVDKALDFNERSKRLAEEIADKHLRTLTLLNYGELYLRTKDTEKALSYLERAYTLAEEIKSRSSLQSVHHILSEAYAAHGDHARAYKHYVRYHEIFAEIHAEQSDEKLKNLRVIHEVETVRKEAEIHRLKNIELAGALKQLEELNQEKIEFLGIAAHNLKTPLANITLLAKILLKDRKISRQEIEEYSGDILTTSEQMFDIIKKLLDINAMEQGRINLSPEPADISALLRALVLTYRKKAERKHIRIHLDAPDPVELVTDRNYALQVFENLLSNAIKYSPHGKNVYVRIERDKHHASCLFIDEGPGVSRSDMNKMFGKFVTLSARPTGGESATGLGLSIVKRLMELMHGSVHCESFPGQGARFSANFPLEWPKSQ